MTLRSRVVMFVLPALLAAPLLARADVITDWNAIMRSTVAGQNPFAQARVAAIVHLAMFEAVNAISGGYEPYLSPRLVAAHPASAEAAAIAAAHRVLATYFPGNSAALDAMRLAALTSISDGVAEDNGVTLGEAAAAAMIALRAADGSSPPAFHMPSNADAGEWQPTPGCPPAGGILAHWGAVTPFGVDDVARFHSSPPPPLSSRQYARGFAEVKEVGSLHSASRPAHGADLARFYAAVLAVATWNPVVAAVTTSQHQSLAFNARLFALLNAAISDALVAVMRTKYEYNLWRPETAIHHADLDGNAATEADASWQPLIASPCFPSYGSAHAAAGYAARRVAELLLGDDVINVALSHPSVPGVVLAYDSFASISEDIDDARVYGGIHFRFDQRAGARQGEKIGSWIVRHVLRPVRKR